MPSREEIESLFGFSKIEEGNPPPFAFSRARTTDQDAMNEG